MEILLHALSAGSSWVAVLSCGATYIPRNLELPHAIARRDFNDFLVLSITDEETRVQREEPCSTYYP